jgi:hypothetical protein
LNSNSQTTVEKINLNSLKEMVPGLPLNFSSLLKEFLTSMVYMGVEVITCNRIYGDGKKVGAGISIPNSLTLPNGL